MRRSDCGQPPRCCRGGVPVSGLEEPEPQETERDDEHRSRPIHRSSRRQFITRSMLLAAGAPTIGAFLEACSTSSSGGSGDRSTVLQLASPDNPVTWPIHADNKPIANGLSPEKGATLRLYN